MWGRDAHARPPARRGVVRALGARPSACSPRLPAPAPCATCGAVSSVQRSSGPARSSSPRASRCCTPSPGGWRTRRTTHATLEILTAGEAKTPFQYRALVPWTVRAVTEAVPLSLPWPTGSSKPPRPSASMRPFVCSWARSSRRQPPTASLHSRCSCPSRSTSRRPTATTRSFSLMTRRRGVLHARPRAPPAPRLWAYYPLFIVATLNRETTCFLAVGYLFVALGRDRTAHVLAHVAAQAVLVDRDQVRVTHPLRGERRAGHRVGRAVLEPDRPERAHLTAVPGLMYLLLVTMGGVGTVVLLLWGRVRNTDVRRLFAVVPSSS